MKICVVGAGAMGCLFGGYLARAGHEVWLIARSADHIQALARHGLILRHDGHRYEIPLHASHESGDAGVCDAVMVMTKASDTAAAMECALSAIGPTTSVVTLQNGVGNVETLNRFVGPERILFGVTALAAVRPGPGEIDVTAFYGAQTFVWSQVDRRTPDLERYVEALANAGFEAVVAPDVKNRIWRKLCLNAGVSAVAAVIGVKAGNNPVPGAGNLRSCGQGRRRPRCRRDVRQRGRRMPPLSPPRTVDDGRRCVRPKDRGRLPQWRNRGNRHKARRGNAV